MRKKYLEPIIEVQKFSFEDILEGSITQSTTAPTEEPAGAGGGGDPVDPGEIEFPTS